MNYLEMRNGSRNSAWNSVYFIRNFMLCNMELNKKNRVIRNMGRKFYSNDRVCRQ